MLVALVVSLGRMMFAHCETFVRRIYTLGGWLICEDSGSLRQISTDPEVVWYFDRHWRTADRLRHQHVRIWRQRREVECRMRWARMP
jgi:hypothetical protein